MRHGKMRICFCASTLIACSLAHTASAVIVGGDNGVGQNNTSAPTGALAGSGWQFEGQFGGFLGTAIAPNYFVTAEHIGAAGQSFVYNGQSYATVAHYDNPTSDLRIWKVDGNLGSYAALDGAATIAGKQLLVTGRGTDRGAAITAADGTLVGWKWGADSATQRWGTNTAVGTVDGGPGLGTLLTATFHGGADATVSNGDSGGGVFVNDAGSWKLAGITYGADIDGTVDGQAVTGAIIGDAFYASSIAANRAWIDSVIGTVGAPTLQAIPEPVSAGLGAIGVLLVGLRRRRPTR